MTHLLHRHHHEPAASRRRRGFRRPFTNAITADCNAELALIVGHQRSFG